MEILAEILLGMLQLVAEFVLQGVFELLADLGIRTTRSWWGPRPAVHPAWPLLGHLLLGFIAGLLSLAVVSHAVIESPAWRIVSLVFTPLIAGLFMVFVGRWRARHDRGLSSLHRFGYAFLFALSMALTRFFATA